MGDVEKKRREKVIGWLVFDRRGQPWFLLGIFLRIFQ